MTGPSIPLRKDAQRNRDLILSTARELFAEAGDVPMYEIARRAGVGQATLYRHFPDREAVVRTIVAEQLGRLEQLAAEHAGDPDAFFVLLRSLVESQIRLHGIVDCLDIDSGAGSEKEALRQRMVDVFMSPLRVAKGAGALRRDASIDDVFLLVVMVDGVQRGTPDPAARAAAATRALTLTLEGLSTPGRPQGAEVRS